MSSGQTPPPQGYLLTQIGLTGGAYDYTSNGGVFRYTTAQSLNAAGEVVGNSLRFTSGGTQIGSDTWLWIGSSTVEIGLTGAGYEFNYGGQSGVIDRSSVATTLNAAGQVIGSSTRYNTSGTSLGSDTWIWTGSATALTGLTGSDYEYTSTGTGGGTFRSSVNSYLSDNGKVIGYDNRYSSTGASLGVDAWAWNGSTTQKIGLTGTGYEYTSSGSGGGTYRNNAASAYNAIGDAIGYSNRYNTASTIIGFDAWLWNGSATRQLGYTGTNYQYNASGGGIYQYSAAMNLNATGQADGFSNRYNSSGASLGSDAWISNGTSTQQLGYTGSGYNYTYTGTGGGTYRFSNPSALNDSGQVIGYSARYTAADVAEGSDLWIWTGSTTKQIGLTGSGYEFAVTGGTWRTGTAAAINAGGQAIGNTNRFNSVGTLIGYDTWVWTGSTTSQTGLTGSDYEWTYTGTGGGTYRQSINTTLGAGGQVIGYTTRYNASHMVLGADPWIWTGTAVKAVGLTGSAYERTYTGSGGGIYRNGAATMLNAAGQAVGTNDRQNSAGSYLGQDTWFWNGTTTQQIGLVGSGFEYTYPFSGGGTYRASSILSLNSAGEVVGASNKYASTTASNGSAAWFYNPGTNVTTALDFGTSSVHGYGTTTASVLTDNGVVLGTYVLNPGTSNEGLRAFWWDEQSGFRDLGGLVQGGLTTAGWQYLDSLVSANGPAGFSQISGGSPFFITGMGDVVGETGGQSVYILAVPEPVNLSLMMLGGLTLLARRRPK